MTMDSGDYRRLVRDLGTWAEAFNMAPDAQPKIVLRGATESSTFIVGDSSAYRFGKSIVLQRRLPSGRGEAYFVLKPAEDGPTLIRQGVIGRDVAPSAMAALTDSLVAAAKRAAEEQAQAPAAAAQPAAPVPAFA
jgi:hypothetical protein